MPDTKDFDQSVINEGKEIFTRIDAELKNAEFEILIATAWFTDPELFTTLLEKADENINIELIIADNQENEKLDFSLLRSKGAHVIKVKNIGFGMMHQKFCVIDKKIALHGSYNWSVNAKTNNHESIIATTHKESVDSLIATFYSIKTKVSENRIESSSSAARIINSEKIKGVPIEIPLKEKSEYEKVLDSMIAAEVGSFDRKMLREQGYERSKSNNGDHQVLNKALDTVYSVFINDIDVVEDKKRRLISKIEEQKSKNIDSLRKTNELQIQSLENENVINERNLNNKCTHIKAEIALCEQNIIGINSNKIPFIQEIIENIDQKIKNLQREFIVPAIKKFELIPTAIFGAGLLLYLFLFYSSAAYILLFSVEDAKADTDKGIPFAPPEVFNPHAISKAIEKGGIAITFIFLFVFIPISFAIIGKFIKSKVVAPILSFLCGIAIVDSAIAYKVSEAIYNVKYATGDVDKPWQFTMAFKDVNFYLVFILGAFGLLLFKFVFDKFISIFEERNPDIEAQKNELLIQHLTEEIDSQKLKLSDYKMEIEDINKTIIQLKAELAVTTQEAEHLPILLSNQLKGKKAELIINEQMTERVTEIYITHVQNDNLPISVDSLKDRINVFLEGWNDYLHNEYSISKATQKSAQAIDTAVLWQTNKLNAKEIDQRVKI